MTDNQSINSEKNGFETIAEYHGATVDELQEKIDQLFKERDSLLLESESMELTEIFKDRAGNLCIKDDIGVVCGIGKYISETPAENVKSLIENLTECTTMEEVQSEVQHFYYNSFGNFDESEIQSTVLALSSGLADGALTEGEVIAALSGTERMDGNEYVSPENMTEAIKLLNDIDPSSLESHAPFIAQFIQGMEDSQKWPMDFEKAMPGGTIDELEPMRPAVPAEELEPYEQLKPALAVAPSP